jgi:hypothetical protein
MVFFAKSIRINCGKPMSAGSERSQITPGSQECASTLAQISDVLPSKSAAKPGGDHGMPAMAHSIAAITFFTVVIFRCLDTS